MRTPSCAYANDHNPGETCPHCKLEVDDYIEQARDFVECPSRILG